METILLSVKAKFNIQSGCTSFGGKTSKRTTTTKSTISIKPLRASTREKEVEFKGILEQHKHFSIESKQKPPRRGGVKKDLRIQALGSGRLADPATHATRPAKEGPSSQNGDWPWHVVGIGQVGIG